MQFRCPNCQHPIRIEDEIQGVGEEDTLDTIECPSCRSSFSLTSDNSSRAAVSPGTKIGHYEIHAVLGEGSFGTVFKVWDTQLFRYVALKVPREGRISKETAKLFLREARAAAGITHPNVIKVYEVGQYDDGCYITTELIEGKSLNEYLKEHSFEPAEAAQLIVKVLRGVQEFNAKGIIHRDLKPGNILLDGINEPHISDFGLAGSEDSTDLAVTHSGRIVGTMLYMSPEQARGEAREFLTRTDLYAIGVIMYELLTGQRPFKATTTRTLFQSIQNDQPVLPRTLRKNIPRDLETICLKAIEKDSMRRFESASEMADELQRFLDQKPILARPTSALEKTWRLICRNRLVSSMVAVLVPLIAVLVFLLMQPEIIPSPLSHSVHLTCQLLGENLPSSSAGDWIILPLDKRTREPVEADAIRIHQSAEARLQLVPGEYLIIVSVTGFGFHEVYRTVPEDVFVQMKPKFNHERWDVAADGTVELPLISIHSDSEILRNMIEVPGGTFIMGDDKLNRPAHSREVAGFYVDPQEVTAEELEKFLPLGTDYAMPRDAPAVSVSWNVAVAYAEFRGKRLLKEHEFEYLAKDIGRSEYPSGAEPVVKPGERWTYPMAGQPQADRLTRLPIFCIHSNVAEWTDSLNNRYPGMPDQGPEVDRIMNTYRNRIVRGGPVTPGPNDREQNTWNESTSFRASWDVATVDNEIGFRCAKSARPRYQN